MAVLLPPSAFMVPPNPATRQNTTTEPQRPSQQSQTPVIELRDISAQTSDNNIITDLVQFVSDIISEEVPNSKSSLNKGSDVDVQFEPLWEVLFDLSSSYRDKSDKIQKLSAAVHRTVPETLEHQRIAQNLDNENKELRSEIDGMSETISLLEKRMECQSKVLAIQEKTLTTEPKTQKMLEAWRKKVLQMLIEREMDNIEEKRAGFALESQIQKLENLCRKQEDEIELLRNKNADLLANLRLKDKHIQQISSELSVAKLSAVKFDQLNVFINNTCTTLTENISHMGENFERFLPDQNVISEKLSLHEEQIERISGKLNVLQSLYVEKEKFYSDKLEDLLIEHTQPLLPAPKTSVLSQTEVFWEDVERSLGSLEGKLTEQQSRTSQLLVEKGVISSQLAEAEAAKFDLKRTLDQLRDQLTSMTERHSEEVVGLQKRESKAAIRAKHLERQVVKKEGELEELEKEFRERWEEEVERFREKITGLENENTSLRQALRKR